MKIRRIVSVALTLLLILGLCLPAAADTGYSGEINPETGQPYGEDIAGDTGDLVALSGNMYYSWDTRDYVYRLPDSAAVVHVSAADGMMLTTAVSIVPGNDATITVFRSGREYTGDLSNCSEVGEYVVSTLVGGSTRRLMSFTVVGKSVSTLHTFVVPDGFYIIDAKRDGKDVNLDRFSVDMESEGAYTIDYECSATNLTYRLEVTVDRTPPAILFRGSFDKQGRIRSKLEFEGLAKGERIYLTRSGEPVSLEMNTESGGTIYDPGNYVMLVFDEAGNTVEYKFIILQYLNVQSGAFILLVTAVIVAVAVYVIVKRKRQRIG